MLPEFSPILWLVIVLTLCLVLYVVVRAIYRKLQKVLQPYKKGKRYWCKIIAVSDGDTVTCVRYNFRRSQTKLRLAYIDAPESSQTYGKETQKMVVKLVHRKIVRIHIVDTDRYGRHVGEIYRHRRSINEELIKQGGAWVYEDYIKDKKKLNYLNKLQQEAKAKKRGLWQQARPMKPSTYRRNNM